MERLAHYEEVYPKVDYYIDLHSGDDFEALTPYVYYAGKAAQDDRSFAENGGAGGCSSWCSWCHQAGYNYVQGHREHPLRRALGPGLPRRSIRQA